MAPLRYVRTVTGVGGAVARVPAAAPKTRVDPIAQFRRL